MISLLVICPALFGQPFLDLVPGLGSLGIPAPVLLLESQDAVPCERTPGSVTKKRRAVGPQLHREAVDCIEERFVNSNLNGLHASSLWVTMWSIVHPESGDQAAEGDRVDVFKFST